MAKQNFRAMFCVVLCIGSAIGGYCIAKSEDQRQRTHKSAVNNTSAEQHLKSNSLSSAKQRYTVVLLPPEEVALDIEAYARQPYFEQFTKAKDGRQLYRLGDDPETGERSRAHITSAQFECTVADFQKVVSFLSSLHKKQDLSTLTATFGGVNFYSVPANSKSYPPAFEYPVTWVDRDIMRSGGVLAFNKQLVAFLGTLESIDQIAKTINGVGDEGYRPHFTLFKAVLPEDKDAVDMPEYKGPKSFALRVAVGKSKLTGEFVEPLGIFENGVFVPVK